MSLRFPLYSGDFDAGQWLWYNTGIYNINRQVNRRQMMASTKEYLSFVLEQMSGVEETL